MKRALATYFLAATFALTLAACGGGGGGGGGVATGGTGGTGISTGVVTAIGSVVVNGVRFTCVGTTISSDDGTIDQGSGDRCVTANLQGALKEGMVVSVEGTVDSNGTEGAATRIVFDNNVEGPITILDTNSSSFTVLGVTVNTNDDTKFEIGGQEFFGPEGFTPLAALFGAGTVFVEVSGLPDGAGAVLATLVQVKAQPANGEAEVKGIISIVSNGNGTTTIRIGGLTITVPSAQVNIPDGACVELKGRVSGNTFILDEIESDDDCNDLNTGDLSFAQVEGIVNGFISASDDFKVGMQRVRVTSSTTYINGTSADLLNGAKVEAKGRITDGLLTANFIKFKPSVRIEAAADSAGDASSNTIGVLGITVRANEFTRFDDDDIATIGAIVAGQCLEIRGLKSGAKEVTATRIRARNGGNGAGCDRTELRGPVDAGSIVSPTNFNILGVRVTTGPNTEYEIEDDEDISAETFYSALTAAQIVKARGDESPDNEINATGEDGKVEIEIEDDD